MARRLQERAPATSRYVFVGALQPDVVHVPSRVPPPPPPAPPSGCSIAGEWVQESASGTDDRAFGPISESEDGRRFAWPANPLAASDGWDSFNGTLGTPGAGQLQLFYHHPLPTPHLVGVRGAFVHDCDHIAMADAPWHRRGTRPLKPPGPAQAAASPVPNATFSALRVAAGATVTLRLALSVGADERAAVTAAQRFAPHEAGFAAARPSDQTLCLGTHA